MGIIITMISVYNTMKSYMDMLNANMMHVQENLYVAEKYDEIINRNAMPEVDEAAETVFEAENISYDADGHEILRGIQFTMRKDCR